MNRQHRLVAAAIDDMAAAMSWSPDQPALTLWAGPQARFGMTVEEAWKELAPPERRTFALRSASGCLLGIGQLAFKEAGWCHLARIVIAPDQRGRGLGRILCERLMEAGIRIEPRLHGWTLFVYPHNVRARRLYETLGFEVCGVSDDSALKMRRLATSDASAKPGKASL